MPAVIIRGCLPSTAVAADELAVDEPDEDTENGENKLVSRSGISLRGKNLEEAQVLATLQA